MTEPESHTLAYLRRIDEKLDRQHAETGVRLERIEDELLVLMVSFCVWKGARSRRRG